MTKDSQKKKPPKSPVTRTKASIAPDDKYTRMVNVFNLMKKDETTFGMDVNWDEHRQGYVSLRNCPVG